MNHRFDRHQLRDRWHGQTQRKHTRKTGRWEPAEDQRLLQVWPWSRQACKPVWRLSVSSVVMLLEACGVNMANKRVLALSMCLP